MVHGDRGFTQPLGGEKCCNVAVASGSLRQLEAGVGSQMTICCLPLLHMPLHCSASTRLSRVHAQPREPAAVRLKITCAGLLSRVLNGTW